MQRGNQHQSRLVLLREALKRNGLDGFLIPLSDEYQSEFPPACSQRLAWLTGFDGSAGVAAVLSERAAIFVDGRYTLQAREQVDRGLFEQFHSAEQPLTSWLRRHAAGKRIGYDPWLHTQAAIARMENTVRASEVKLVSVPSNPIDSVWYDRPSPPEQRVFIYHDKMAGRNSAEKRGKIAQGVKKTLAEAAVITSPESIAWLLNIRGGDLLHTPVPLCYAIIWADSRVTWFISPERVPRDIRDHLGSDVEVLPPATFDDAIKALGTEKTAVLVPDTSPARVSELLRQSGGTIINGLDPCELPKACKNTAELAGIRAAHIRDGAALSSFLCWLSKSVLEGDVDELGAAEKLYQFRAKDKIFRGLSFDTISAAGSNGAIVHYRANKKTNKHLTPGSLYLVDSGAQYMDGTTDVTRTVAIGVPTDEMRDRFTRVLQGHIAIATARFPAGSPGGALDSFARRPLWEIGLDFDHGTGHGVGCFLGVHEGPQRIAKRGGGVPLSAGMVISNEPGFYKEGSFGIRIENLEVVRDLKCENSSNSRMLGFESLTLVPIDRSLVVTSMLDDKELSWWEEYHKRVLEAVGPLVDGSTLAWLKKACLPLTIEAS
ncbi:MAG: aminopeptidase P family protein [Alphaproteobacteria bacterium]